MMDNVLGSKIAQSENENIKKDPGFKLWPEKVFQSTDLQPSIFQAALAFNDGFKEFAKVF